MDNDEKIYSLIAKYVSGEALPEEAMQLEAWSNESEKNRLFLEGFLWLSGLSTDRAIGAMKAPIWKNIRHEIAIKPIVFLRSKVRRVLVAASILIFIVSTLFIYTTQVHPSRLEYVTDGTSKTITLQDATEVELSPFSSIKLEDNYGDTSRQINLTGSASFSVKHDETRPFVITIGKLRIKDAGTRFSVSTIPKADEVMVAVYEGSVIALSDDGNTTELHQSEAASFRKSSGNLLSVKSSNGKTPKHNVKNIVSNLDTANAKDELVMSSTEQFNADTTISFTLADAEKVLGERVSLVNKDENQNDGSVRLSLEYRVIDKAHIALVNNIEKFSDENSAQNAYTRLRIKYPSVSKVPSLDGQSIQAFETRESNGIYVIVLQTRHALVQVKIFDSQSSYSSQNLYRILREKADQIRTLSPK